MHSEFDGTLFAVLPLFSTLPIRPLQSPPPTNQDKKKLSCSTVVSYCAL